MWQVAADRHGLPPPVLPAQAREVQREAGAVAGHAHRALPARPGCRKLIHNRMVAGRLYSRVVMRLPVSLAARVSAQERARAITRQLDG